MSGPIHTRIPNNHQLITTAIAIIKENNGDSVVTKSAGLALSSTPACQSHLPSAKARLLASTYSNQGTSHTSFAYVGNGRDGLGLPSHPSVTHPIRISTPHEWMVVIARKEPSSASYVTVVTCLSIQQN